MDLKRNILKTMIVFVMLQQFSCVSSSLNFNKTPSTNEITLKTPPPPKKVEGFTTIEEGDDDPYPSVALLLDNDYSPVCSATLIEEDTLLTAAHCIDDGDVCFVRIGDSIRDVRDTVYHPNFSDNRGNIRYDVGLVFLETPIVDIEPTPLNDMPLYGREGFPITTVGYSKGFKKYSEIGTFWYYGTLESEPTNMKFLTPNGSIWFGDSGGPVFMYVEGKKKIIGIISSFSMTMNGYKIYENSATRVDMVWSWIHQEMFLDNTRFIYEEVDKHEGLVTKKD